MPCSEWLRFGVRAGPNIRPFWRVHAEIAIYPDERFVVQVRQRLFRVALLGPMLKVGVCDAEAQLRLTLTPEFFCTDEDAG
jgi:hypothetical protein